MCLIIWPSSAPAVTLGTQLSRLAVETCGHGKEGRDANLRGESPLSWGVVCSGRWGDGPEHSPHRIVPVPGTQIPG